MQLSEPDPGWPAAFAAYRERLVRVLPGVAVEHVGSTAIPGIAAKPIVDILVGAEDASRWEHAYHLLRADGWIAEGRREAHAWLTRPDPACREAIVHLVIAGDAVWRKRTAFRDHLRAHPGVALEYQQLKRRLAAEHADDLDGYTRAEAGFVARVLVAAGLPG